MSGGPRSRFFLRLRGSIARRGWWGSLRLAARQAGDMVVRSVRGATRYERWLADRPRVSATLSGPEAEHPLISVLVPSHDPDLHWLERAIGSVRAQSYEKWELCVVDDASGTADVREWLRSRGDRDPRIRCIRLQRNVGISGATNAALELANGPFFALLDHDDELAPHALFEMAAAIRRFDPDLLYSDEDKIDVDGRLRDAAFKPDFSPDWLLSCNFISHLGVFRSALTRELGGFRSEFDGSQDYDLALRFADRSARIHHVPRVLYHWRTVRGSTADPWAEAKPWAYDAARRAIASHLERVGERGEVGDGPGRGFYRVRRFPPVGASATLIAWGDRDRAARLAAAASCDAVILDASRPTASQLNGAAARASGDVLVFVDARLQPSATDWLPELMSQALRSDVGCVGTRISARGNRVLHAGVVLGGAKGIRLERPALFGDEPGPMGASGVIRNASAVSGGCLAVSVMAFRHLGGFDASFGESLHDVDLGLRAWDAGMRVIYDPHAEMRSPRARLPAPAEADVARLIDRWGARIHAGDPYYNPAFGFTGPLFEARLRPGPQPPTAGKL